MSRFVTAGSHDDYDPRNEAWAEAEAKIKDSQKPRIEPGQQEGGKSLYEVLQANKAAKQEAFEEKMKLKNQFRNLDEDEVEFLDAVMASTRAKEESIRKETTEQLEEFRKQQDEVQKVAADAAAKDDDEDEGDDWTVTRKRKRTRDKDGLKGVKLRRSSSATHHTSDPPVAETRPSESSATRKAAAPRPSSAAAVTKAAEKQRATSDVSKAPALGLVAYGSDSDD